MSEFVYKDYLPLNARIIIDYSQKKGEKVKFSYPVEMEYKKAVWNRAFPTIYGFYLLLLFYVVSPIAIIWVVTNSLMSLPSFVTNFFVSKTETSTTLSPFLTIIVAFPIILLAIFFFIGFPVLITIYLARNKDRLSRWIPRFGYWSGILAGFLKEKEFISRDVEEKRVIIPIFSNVFLKWFPEGDFDEYLEKIEILEIPFEFKRRVLIFGKWKITQNEYFFRAVFLFSQKPENGSLRVEFI